MEFRNLTPFDALCFSALGVDDQEYPVLAMKVGYRLLPVDGQPGQWRAEVMDDDPATWAASVLRTLKEPHFEAGECLWGRRQSRVSVLGSDIAQLLSSRIEAPWLQSCRPCLRNHTRTVDRPWMAYRTWACFFNLINHRQFKRQ